MLGAGMGEMISGGGPMGEIDNEMDDLDALESGGGDGEEMVIYRRRGKGRRGEGVMESWGRI